jgi:hypothetical protein
MNIDRIVKASYFGIEVELVSEMSQCSLVRYQQRSFVVDTADVVVKQKVKKTAKKSSSARAA